jgi:DNA polymerase/3'-5' exonuclease PolX
MDAYKIAKTVMEELSPGAERIVIAGSIRRGKQAPKDIEIVYLPAMEERQVDMFSVEPRPVMDRVLIELAERRFLVLDPMVKRNGPKYKRLIHVASGMVVELFTAETENWGLVLALRTGPADFNQLLVSRLTGAMPMDMKMEGGWLWRRGVWLQTPEEEDFFREIGVPCWPPGQRTAERLRAWMEKRGRP